MSFDDFLNQAWSDHAKDSQTVADRLKNSLSLLEKSEQIPQLAGLATHVFGEHLGRWDEGIAFLSLLKSTNLFQKDSESDRAVERSVAALMLAKGQADALGALSNSDRIRVLSVAAAALSEQKQSERAFSYFRDALELVGLGLEKGDPANRALAVTGNNLACALEEKHSRSEKETELMILAARTGRKFWEIAGTWLEVERAEYRLSQTYLKSGDLKGALEHAQACVEIASENNAPPLELFFGFEALSLVEKARHNQIGFSKALARTEEYFQQLSAEDRTWCEESLTKLRKN